MECTLKSTFLSNTSLLFSFQELNILKLFSFSFFFFSPKIEILLQGKEELVPCALPEVDEEQGWEEALADEGAGG